MSDVPTTLELSQRSMAAVESRDREAWLALFTDDSIVEDPIGPSVFDPTGAGHRGLAAIASFYDNVIATNQGLKFDVERSIECGLEVANLGPIRITLTDGTKVKVSGVYTYRGDGAGHIAALRAYWSMDQVEIEP